MYKAKKYFDYFQIKIAKIYINYRLINDKQPFTDKKKAHDPGVLL